MQIWEIDHIIDFLQATVRANILQRKCPALVILELDDGSLEAYGRLTAIAGNEFFRFILRNGDLRRILILFDEACRNPRIFVRSNVDVVGNGATASFSHGGDDKEDGSKIKKK